MNFHICVHLPKHHLHLEHGPIPQEVLSLPFPVSLPQKINHFSDFSQWRLVLPMLLLLLCCFSRVQLCVTPIDGSPPGSPPPGSLQARTLEWVAIAFSNAWKWKVKVKWLSRVQLLATPWTAAYQAPPSMGFSRQEYSSGLPLPSPSTYTRKEQKLNLTAYTFWCLDSFI